MMQPWVGGIIGSVVAAILLFVAYLNSKLFGDEALIMQFIIISFLIIGFLLGWGVIHYLL